MEVKDIDICITTYNRNPRLTLILDSLSKQTNMNFNLIINDDGSKSLINPNDYSIISKYIWNKDYKYNRVARFNESILMGTSPKIIILDDDCVPVDENFVNGHLEALNNADISRGVVTFPWGAEANSWFSTANAGFNRNIIHDYGLFFPEYNGHYGYEDNDLGEEVKQRQLSVIYNQNARVLTGNEFYLNGDRSEAVIGRNKALFTRRWGKEPHFDN